MLATEASPLLDDRFLPLESLGHGGAGRVLRAFDRTRQELVALKVLDLPARAGPAHPLSGEFEAWARLRHPNVVRAHELRRSRSGPLPAGTPYLVLEHVRGEPAHRALPPQAASETALLSLAQQVLGALSHVHGRGLVHRDVKPGNVLVRRGPRGLRAKLTDFGLATAVGRAELPGCISGSLPYVAPEVLLGEPVDGRADLYGLGLLLYVLASGTLPMGTDAEPETVLAWHLRGPELDLRARRPDLSPGFARFIARLAARERERRPSDAVAALALAGRPSSSAPRVQRALPRDTLATLRLALDAARLGGRRVLCVPPGGCEEAAVRAQVLGLAVLRLAPDLAACTLELLVELRRGRTRGLPLSVFGGLPVLDGTRWCDASRSPAACEAAAAGIAALIAEAARQAPRAVLVPAGRGEHDRLLTATVEHVRALAERGHPGGAPGLLVVVEEAPRSGTVPVTLAR
ncbi:MAG TPA: serine/threonine-protein kinase [Candidatus Polarisedimenticolaceae bacterium]|nr:serine/threonine-protein kinase [Candidatus Polarisedimenticolaceae bacterium]